MNGFLAGTLRTARALIGGLDGIRRQWVSFRSAARVALHFTYVNFERPHKSLANPYPRTLAMAAGLADHIWTCEEIAAPLD